MTNQEADNVRNSRLAIEATQRESCEDEDIAKAFQLGLAFGLDEKHNEMDKTLQQEPCDIQKLKAGDTVLVKCKVEAVFTNSQMVMVTTRDCDKGFDAYRDEVVCVRQDNIKQIKREPCDDCISRQAVLDINERHHGQMPNHVNHEIWKEIKALPSVTPMPKMGRWIIKDGKEQGYDIAGTKTWYIQIMCDKCGFIKTAIEGHIGQYKFCPKCGQPKMQEVKDE